MLNNVLYPMQYVRIFRFDFLSTFMFSEIKSLQSTRLIKS